MRHGFLLTFDRVTKFLRYNQAKISRTEVKTRFAKRASLLVPGLI